MEWHQVSVSKKNFPQNFEFVSFALLWIRRSSLKSVKSHLWHWLRGKMNIFLQLTWKTKSEYCFLSHSASATCDYGCCIRYGWWHWSGKWNVLQRKCLWQSTGEADLYALLSSSLIKLEQIHSLSKLIAGGRSKWIFTYFWWCTIQSCCLCSIMLYANMMHHTMWDWQTYKAEWEQF